jgi:hypothetical protein
MHGTRKEATVAAHPKENYNSKEDTDESQLKPIEGDTSTESKEHCRMICNQIKRVPYMVERASEALKLQQNKNKNKNYTT